MGFFNSNGSLKANSALPWLLVTYVLWWEQKVLLVNNVLWKKWRMLEPESCCEHGGKGICGQHEGGKVLKMSVGVTHSTGCLYRPVWGASAGSTVCGFVLWIFPAIHCRLRHAHKRSQIRQKQKQAIDRAGNIYSASVLPHTQLV